MDTEKIAKMIEDRYPDADGRDWIGKLPLGEADAFLEAKNALPQKIGDETAMAWYYGFHRQTHGWKDEDRKEKLNQLLLEMKTLSPYDAAIVAERLYGEGRCMSRSAETVAREKKMLVSPKVIVQPKTNHMKLAAKFLADGALETAMGGLRDAAKIEIVRKEKYNQDGPIMSSGSRYLFLEADGRPVPVLRIVGKETDFDTHALELGAMAAQSEDFAGAVIVALDPETLFYRSEFVSRETLMPCRDQALAAATEFMERHVMRDVPIPRPVREGKKAMDDAQKETFNDLARDAAYWAEVEKGAKEKGEAARGRMLAFAETCAGQLGVPVSGLGIPKDLFTMRVKQSVDEDELSAILEMDGAREAVMGMKPNSKKMEKALKARKIPQAEWCDETVDMKALAKFCEDSGLSGAIIEEASFASNPKGDAALRGRLSESAGELLEKSEKAFKTQRMGM